MIKALGDEVTNSEGTRVDATSPHLAETQISSHLSSTLDIIAAMSLYGGNFGIAWKPTQSTRMGCIVRQSGRMVHGRQRAPSAPQALETAIECHK